MTNTQKVRSNIYLDAELKETAKELFKSYGVSLSDGINLLLKQATDKKMLILDIEPVYPNDPDYKLMQQTKKEKSHSLDKVLQEFNAN